MANFIERNNVINYLRNEVPLGTFMKRTIGKADEACWSICNGIITKVPTVDAEPVRHAKWYELATYDGCEVDLRCSNCGATVSGFVQGYKYCPYCGSRNEVNG